MSHMESADIIPVNACNVTSKITFSEYIHIVSQLKYHHITVIISKYFLLSCRYNI